MEKNDLQKALDELNTLKSNYDLPIEEKTIQLNILKERNRILKLYTKVEDQETEQIENEELAIIRNHLEPLELAPEGTPLSELARLAARYIMNNENKQNK
jgi:hypothetical protein